ncbi:hypothetical protein H4F99_04700 [Lysobacter sp. SG-8]|uniref:Uncharacterized protein n=1 Tax=Marilutibacter penaei TaxID=2759900 RepID=A0A7W3U367_9GAMM|nr:hypothetical protein [Lysobacter penaei]MBB1087785.1 hypothetical protein [Lysobacter penaei]
MTPLAKKLTNDLQNSMLHCAMHKSVANVLNLLRGYHPYSAAMQQKWPGSAIPKGMTGRGPPVAAVRTPDAKALSATSSGVDDSAPDAEG